MNPPPPQHDPGGVYQGGQYQAPPPGGPPPPAAPPPGPPPAGPQYPPPPSPGPPQYQAPQHQPPQYQAPPGSPPQFPPAGTPPPPMGGPPPSKGRGKLVGIVIVGSVAAVGILVVMGVVAVRLLGGGDGVPEVGDCVNNAFTDSLIEVVDCGSEEAYWTVIGLDGTMSQAAWDNATEDDICTGFPEWENAMLFVTSDDSGEVICLTRRGGPDPADE